MDLSAANLLASVLTLGAAITVGVWYLAPACRRRTLSEALTLLLWFHVFRYVALQIFSAAEFGGLDASLAEQRVIAFGDLASSVLALVTIWALRRPLAVGRPLAWLAAGVGIADLVSASLVGIRSGLTDTASDWSWFVLAVYVPFLWVTAIMIVWQLTTRRREPLRGTEPTMTNAP